MIINGTHTHTCEIIGTKLEKQRNTHGPNSPITTVSSSTNVSGMIYDSDWLCVVSTEWTRQSIHGFQRVLMHEQQRQFKIGHNIRGRWALSMAGTVMPTLKVRGAPLSPRPAEVGRRLWPATSLVARSHLWSVRLPGRRTHPPGRCARCCSRSVD